jgi:hypothetical protein
VKRMRPPGGLSFRVIDYAENSRRRDQTTIYL